jgi:hypothetical protein
MSQTNIELLFCVVVWIGVAMCVTLFFFITTRWQQSIDKHRLANKNKYQPLYNKHI